MADTMVKGSYVSASASFARNNYPPERWEQIEAGLSREVSSVLPNIRGNDWYPVQCATEILRGIYESHDNPTDSEAAIRRCGNFIGQEASTTWLKFLFKILTAELFATKFPDFYRKYNSVGDCRADAKNIKQNRFTLELLNGGYDYVHLIGCGWIEFVFGSLGKSNVVVETNIPLGQRGSETIQWKARWE